MKKLILKDATNKVQFDKEWFYKLDDIAFYFKKEDLIEVEFISFTHVTMENKSL
jgi:hypothetical protein